jgi:hypothetical protein
VVALSTTPNSFYTTAMKNQFQFKIQNLLSIKGHTVSGPMSPLLFAQEVTTKLVKRLNMLARIWFNDEAIHQYREDGGFTGHDTLVIGTVLSNDLQLSLWVDEGVRGVPVAMAFGSDREITITPAYHKNNYHQNLSPQQIKEIFEYLFDNIHLLEPQQE